MLIDPVIQDELSKNGYAVLETYMTEPIDHLLSYIGSNFNFPASDFYYSLLSNSYEKNLMLQNVIRKSLQPFYARYFENCRTHTESFLVKPAKTYAELLLHQDWCYTDEHIHNAYNLWIPLNDVSETNGAMFFIPGSHLWFDNLRSATLPTARINSAYFLDHGAAAVKLKKGQALIFHPAIFHGSFPNLSTENRIVITANIMPQEAQFIYFQKLSEDEVGVVYLDDNAFLRDLNSLAIGDVSRFSQIRQIKYSHSLITESDLIGAINDNVILKA